MSTSDVLALVAVIVSVFSALTTIYFQYFEHRRVAVALGDEIYLGYGDAEDGGGYSSLGIVLSLSLVNGGARDALVTAITARVSSVEGDMQTIARWRSFFEPVEGGAAGRASSSPTWQFKGWVRPLAATSRRVVTEWVYFCSTPIKSALVADEYVLELEVTETRPARPGWGEAAKDAERRALARWVGSFSIDESTEAYLKTNCVAIHGRTPDSSRVRLRRRRSPALRSSKALTVPR